jgi:hypothetical protein
VTAIDEIRARLAALAAVLPVLESSTEAEFGTWVSSTQGADGSWTMPYVDYGPTREAFTTAAARGEWVRPDVDWTSWAQTDEARSIHADPSRIAAASTHRLAQLVTMFVRGDRFNEGYLLEAFVQGHLTAIARRAQVLLDDPTALEAAIDD